MQIKMSWLHELIHEIHRLGLLLPYQITSATEKVVCFLTAVIFVPIVLNPSDYSSSFLLNHNKNSKELNCPSCEEFQVFEERRSFGVNSFQLQPCYKDISCIEAPSYHKCLSNLTNLHKHCNEPHLFVRKSRQNDKVGKKENEHKRNPNEFIRWRLSLNFLHPAIARGWRECTIHLPYRHKEKNRKAITFNLTKLIIEMVDIVEPWHLTKVL